MQQLTGYPPPFRRLFGNASIHHPTPNSVSAIVLAECEWRLLTKTGAQTTTLQLQARDVRLPTDLAATTAKARNNAAPTSVSA